MAGYLGTRGSWPLNAHSIAARMPMNLIFVNYSKLIAFKFDDNYSPCGSTFKLLRPVRS
jgi:hypothetical protein